MRSGPNPFARRGVAWESNLRFAAPPSLETSSIAESGAITRRQSDTWGAGNDDAVEGLPMAFQHGDAEALPFADDTFDAVLSTFGALFDPGQVRTPARSSGGPVDRAEDRAFPVLDAVDLDELTAVPLALWDERNTAEDGLKAVPPASVVTARRFR